MNLMPVIGNNAVCVRVCVCVPTNEFLATTGKADDIDKWK